MTWVKICGITNLEDALKAVDAGADAVGFVFHEKSLRNVGAEAVREMVEAVAIQHRQSRSVCKSVRGFDLLGRGRSRPYCDPNAWRQRRSARRGFGCAAAAPSENRSGYFDASSTTRWLGHDVASRCSSRFPRGLWRPAKLGGTGETFDWQTGAEEDWRYRKSWKNYRRRRPHSR